MKDLTIVEDGPGAYILFKQLVLDSYGLRGADGRSFHKSPEIRKAFEDSLAMPEMIVGFLADEGLGVAFVGGLLPQDKMQMAIERVQAKKNAAAGVHVPQQVAPVRPVQAVPSVPQDEPTAAADTRIAPAQPVASDTTMSTSEKRMYTQEELDAITGVPGSVPPAPDQPNETYTDEQVLAMNAQQLAQKGLLMRAYQLKSQQG